MIIISEKRSKFSTNETDATEFDFQKIYEMILKNDINTIRIISAGCVHIIGSSAVTKKYTSKFTDKKYFIDEREYDDPLVFKESLYEHSNNGIIMVVSIDE